MLSLIPRPQQVVVKEGTYVLPDEIRISSNVSENISFHIVNTLLSNTGVNVIKSDEDVKFKLIINDEIKEEGYNLSINEEGILFEAKEDSGFFYALMTLVQIIAEYGRNLPFCEIKDYPRFKVRSFMLDVCRYFFPVKDVKTFIDIMALLKFNVLHLHLTEDQGWRIEIDKYPLLTEQGSKRDHTNFNHTPHEGFFTKDDIRYIVDYCHKRYIKVVPEIDMPGHMVAAISCYKYLSCFDREIPVATHFGVKHDILCAGKESTYEFVKDVLDEVIELFPDGVIHLGGDEAVKQRWNLCPNCLKKMEEYNVDADGLQSIFLNDISRYIKDKGYTSIIWNETREDNLLNKDVIWNYYIDDKKSQEVMVNEINNGRKCINVSGYAYYCDLPYHDIPLTHSYNYEPVLEGIKKENEENVLGVECDLWTEYVPNMKVACKKLFPRMFAIAESAWLSKEEKNYDEFLKRLEIIQGIVYSITGYEQTTVKHANPNWLRAAFEKMWFEKRQLHWEGAKILREDNKIKREAKKLK